WLFWRVVQGFATAPIYTSISTRLARAYTGNGEFHQVVGIQEMLGNAGVTIAPLLGGVLFAWGGFKLPFMLSAVMHILFVGITLFSSGAASSEVEPLLDGERQEPMVAVTAFSVCSLPVLLLNFVPLLCLGVFGGYEPILGSRFHEVLGRIHPATVGLLMSMSGFPSTLFTFFVPTLVEKIGSRSLMTLGLLLYGFGTFCFGIVPGAPGSTSNWAMQLTALILIGSGWAMCWTPALPCMVDAAALRLRKDSGCSVQAARHHVSPAVMVLQESAASACLWFESSFVTVYASYFRGSCFQQFMSLAAGLHLLRLCLIPGFIARSSSTDECAQLQLLDIQKAGQGPRAPGDSICESLQLVDKEGKEIGLSPRSPAKLIDTFAFVDKYEAEELLLRVSEMSPLVDEFHIVEGDRDSQGRKKTYGLESVLRSKSFDPFRAKITSHKAVIPEGVKGYNMQNLQNVIMNKQMQVDKNYDPEDVILYGDLDEIVSQDALRTLKHCRPAGGTWNARVNMTSYWYGLAWNTGHWQHSTPVFFFRQLWEGNLFFRKNLVGPAVLLDMSSTYNPPNLLRARDQRPIGWHVTWSLDGAAGVAHKNFLSAGGVRPWFSQFHDEDSLRHFLETEFYANPSKYQHHIQRSRLRKKDVPQVLIEHPELFPNVLRDFHFIDS
ncbi:unnamed protein product, partial [Symbiodinium microadriaticum]